MYYGFQWKRKFANSFFLFEVCSSMLTNKSSIVTYQIFAYGNNLCQTVRIEITYMITRSKDVNHMLQAWMGMREEVGYVDVKHHKILNIRSSKTTFSSISVSYSILLTSASYSPLNHLRRIVICLRSYPIHTSYFPLLLPPPLPVFSPPLSLRSSLPSI